MKKGKVSFDKNLYRRGFGPPDKRYLNPDGSATSRVFKLREKDNSKLSVDIKEMISKEDSVGDLDKFVLFEISVVSVESIELSAYHEPIPNNTAHAYIWGLNIDDDIKPGQLARLSRRVIF
jgi:hypothetical protein